MNKRNSLLLLLSLFAALVTHAQDWRPKQAQLMTSFANDVNPEQVLPEYPRPQLVRQEWLNLNGLWQYQPGTGQSEPLPSGQLSGTILVPFAVESALSGVMEHHPRLWYKRNFSIPTEWSGMRLILHFGAVDYEAEVFVNGQSIGTHHGGYDAFSFDITDYLSDETDQKLAVRVYDPTDSGGFPRGKQTWYPGGIMYTSTTGIWQTVWLEPVTETHIETIRLTPDIDQSILKLTVNTKGNASGLSISARVEDQGSPVTTIASNANQEISIEVPNAKLWSPDSPFLYDLKITLSKDGEPIDYVGSYFGMRKISVESEDGYRKLYLNNEFLFQMGPLDQGFWPDGLYTAPTDEALRYDLEKAKAFGFNMVRKHIKVEPQRWYYWADKLGLMVWQDMPSVNSYTSNPQPIDQYAYESELTELVQEHWNAPSIVMWVVFNEGQGQHHTPELVQKVKNLDPSRLVNQASGGNFFGVGDVLDVHSYPPPACPKSSTQTLACGEYGGVGYKIPGHIWDGSFSYVMANTEEELLTYYEDFIDQLTIFKSNSGLSAAVYTEITDVEIELNGLMTYDRIIKSDVDRIYQANRKVIEEDLFLTEVVPNSSNSAQSWKYTFNPPASNWNQSDFDDSNWSSGSAGFGTEGTPGAVIRTLWSSDDIWLRKEVQIGDLSAKNQENLVLTIHHDEDCEVYINGVWAASLSGWTTSYVTTPISAEAKNAIVSGTNTIAIHCKQTAGGQYIDAGISILSSEKIGSISTSTNDMKQESGQYLFPNPTLNTVHFSQQLPAESQISVYNNQGSVLKQLSGALSQIDVSTFRPGYYLIKVNDNCQQQRFRFLKL
ncbi:sugar-binding domain-containing protein [Mangrovibacterium diazotrophicum]|uniref:Putative secreted protein (Por secretion system target) n=1 Tax=Mangrovibacterium diazotrophicum TaxID=1261403 RepID=A0A419W779_9BACT|nr:sugar-binding domain-containing protein [Mangrovibacterium diazotrophicum]RKD91324.1 putative secreted protein (Por secretion system target) [Mangrovibacterium diazotrophicum]